MIVRAPRFERWPGTIPPYWKWTPVAAAARVVSDGGKRISTADYEADGPVPVIDQGQGFIAGYTSELSAMFSDVPAIVFGDHTRRVKLVDFPFAVGAQGVKLLKPEAGWDLRFLAYALAMCPLDARGYSRHWSYLRKVDIPQPPIPEQVAIADWLDSMGSRLDAADGVVRGMQAKTSRHRASILARAWQASANSAGGAGPGSPQTWRPIPDLVGEPGLFRDGDWIETKDQAPDGDVRLTQLADIGVGEWLDRSNRWLTQETALHLRCTYLHEGDVLIARMADPLARACIFPGATGLCVTAVDVCIVRICSDEVNPRWFMWMLNSPQFKTAAEQQASGSTRKRISRRNLGSIRLPLPTIAEQVEIAEAVDRTISLIDDVEHQTASARRRAENLSLAISARALSGSIPAARVSGG